MKQAALKKICAAVRNTPRGFYRQYLVSYDGELKASGSVLNNGNTVFERGENDILLQFSGNAFCSHDDIKDQFYFKRDELDEMIAQNEEY